MYIFIAPLSTQKHKRFLTTAEKQLHKQTSNWHVALKTFMCNNANLVSYMHCNGLSIANHL